MSTRGLTFDEAPPLMPVLRSFLLAPWFLAAAGVVLLSAGPTVWADRYTPGLLAATHLVTIGFLTLVATAAVFQLVPVIEGVGIPYAAALLPVVRSGFAMGAVLLAAAFLSGSALIFGLATVPLALAAGTFIIQAIAVLWRRPRHRTLTPMAYAIVMLGVALTLGLIMAGARAAGAALPSQLSVTHPLWALAGGYFVLWAAVAAQVLPMFQGVRLWPARLSLGLGPLVLTLLTAIMIADIGTDGMARATVSVALAVVIVAAAAIVGHGLWTRTRRRIDSMTVFWYMGLAGLMGAGAVSGLLSAGVLTGLKAPIVCGFLAIAVAAVSFMNGMLYKIVPFLIWLHLQRQGTTRPIVMSSVIDERAIWRQAIAHALAIILCLAAIGWPQPLSATAAVAWIADGALLGINLHMAVAFYRRAPRADEAGLPHATL
ncbi:hypothetical protein [Acidiferrobacter sp.]|uniref:hypothetical protein n=1 Tax=Acidiferrobacter sp. TaxID=1872107 RepID=UPI00261DA2CB|nr:hypothetical protein [Acidiferrobacter sp.]